ncbi:MAG: hypothetical protein CL565_00025 [Alphaproteobacteria bacterium]|nr:hypothetical protein [Alphaproteobacteria bacterium]
MSKKLLLAAASFAALNISPALAETSNTELQDLRAEIAQMQAAYETKINQLENKLETLETRQAETSRKDTVSETQQNSNVNTVRPATSQRRVNDNSFNPEIGVILQGQYQSFSEDEGDFAGFAIGEEAERGDEGLGLDETELNFSANVDDLFRGSTTVALHEHEDELEVELEEAYIESLALPYGLQAKAGRFFSELGYLNSHHAHSDDFADRPLPNRVFLDSNYNDDGVQLSMVLPTDIYSEIGGGVFRGDDFPSGGAEGSDIGAWSAYGRVGGDIGDNTSWRLGLSTLQSNDVSREANEDTVTFDGNSDLYVADARAVYAPTGNNTQQELILQGEFFVRDEDGQYEDTDAGTGSVAYDDSQSGWYAQTVYKFHPQWRVGARYSQLYSADVPAGLVGSALDDEGHNPWSTSAMVDWTHSEFSRARLQYNYEELADGQEDNQIILQYIMSLGAHGAHAY